MRLKFRFEVGTHYNKVGQRVNFRYDIGKYYPGLKFFGRKTYIILEEDIHLNLFKLSRGDIWISRSVIDNRLAKLLSRFKQI